MLYFLLSLAFMRISSSQNVLANSDFEDIPLGVYKTAGSWYIDVNSNALATFMIAKPFDVWTRCLSLFDTTNSTLVCQNLPQLDPSSHYNIKFTYRITTLSLPLAQISIYFNSVQVLLIRVLATKLLKNDINMLVVSNDIGNKNQVCFAPHYSATYGQEFVMDNVTFVRSANV